MYQDPGLVRSKKMTMYLNEYEDGVIAAYARLYGIPKATLMRDLAMKEAADLLGLSDAKAGYQSFA